jgi:hypothetical protein
MTMQKWLESEVRYGREVVAAGLEGIRSGGEAFLNGEPLTPFLSESARKALKPAAVGACLGLSGGYTVNQSKSINRILALGLVGGAIGFGLGIAWENRRLTAGAVDAALKKIGKVRDDHWFERHPIDYA